MARLGGEGVVAMLPRSVDYRGTFVLFVNITPSPSSRSLIVGVWRCET